MSHRVNRIFLFVFFTLLFSSCRDEHKELVKLRKCFYEESLSIIGKEEYYTVYKNISDSINVWKNHKLNYYQYLGDSKNYIIDSLLCFNPQKNKCICAILMQQLLQEGVQDDIWYFYGAKVKGEWLFFDGPSVVLIRKRYQHDIHKPIPFEKMKDLSMKYIYSGYLKKNESQEWVVNEHFFQDLTSSAWGPESNTPAQWDSTYLAIIRRNWEKRDK